MPDVTQTDTRTRPSMPVQLRLALVPAMPLPETADDQGPRMHRPPGAPVGTETDGCAYASSCLHCHLPACIETSVEAEQEAIMLRWRQIAAEQRFELGDALDEQQRPGTVASALLRISERTWQRMRDSAVVPPELQALRPGGRLVQARSSSPIRAALRRRHDSPDAIRAPDAPA